MDEEILVGDDAVSFARQVLVLLNDAELRHRLGRRGRRLAESRFDWSASAARLTEAYEAARRSEGDRCPLSTISAT
jgi:glycosyltransferase involved in cell wall biosynthesis